MIRITCLSPMKSYSYCSSAFAHLELDLQTSNNNPSTRGNQRATIQSKQKNTSKNNTPKQRKALKERIKEKGSLLRLRERKKREKRN